MSPRSGIALSRIVGFSVTRIRKDPASSSWRPAAVDRLGQCHVPTWSAFDRALGASASPWDESVAAALALGSSAPGEYAIGSASHLGPIPDVGNYASGRVDVLWASIHPLAASQE